MLALSMAIFGTISLFVKSIPLSSGEIALFRALLALVLIALYLIANKNPIPFKKIKKALPLLFVSGGAMGVNWILLFEAYEYTSVSIATLSYYFAPVIVTLACPVLFKEKLTKKQILCFIMSTVGLVLIIGVSGFGEGKSDIKGILFGLGAAAFYASVILLNKFIKGVSGIHRTFLQFLSAAVVVLPYVLVSSGVHVLSLPPKGIACLLVLGLVHTGVAYILYFSSLKELPGQKAAILSYIDPLISVAVSVLILEEPISSIQIVGGALILVFTLINELSLKKQ
ncbi:MAG: EamA family transporter [Clostridia bacterium]|nr:EamA family transporter [Clostridia bacterium]